MLSKKYMAGLMDGEGSFTILKCKNYLRNQRGGGEYFYRPHIVLGITNKKFIKKIQKSFGGNLTSFQAKSKNNKAKRCFTLNWCAHIKVIKLIEEILPFLILKKEQAKLVLNFSTSRLSHPKQGCYHHPIIDDEIKIYYQLKKINKRGR